MEPFQVDPARAREDSEGPAPFRDVTALTHRIEAERCKAGVCTASSCGDAGVLELRFQAPPEATVGELGYRVVWLSGELPQAMRARLDLVLPLDAAANGISLELGWSGVTELDGELALVAVDRAGNESAPSDPVPVSWSGCTDYYDEPFCLESGALSQVRDNRGCSLVSGVRGGRGLPLAAAVGAGLIAAMRLRRRR